MTSEELTERELPCLGEYTALAVHSAQDVRCAFRAGSYFECAVDDPLNALAFDAHLAYR